jgi:hypothetical protein
MLTAIRRRWRFLFFVMIPCLLFGCGAELASFFGVAGPVLAQAGAQAFSAAIDDAEKATKKPPTDPQVTKLRKRVKALEDAERREALERAKERAADLRALSAMAREIATLRGELTEGIEALRRSAPGDAGVEAVPAVSDASADGAP